MKAHPHVVYRLYDKDDALLYIGITNDIGSRLTHHQSPTINPFAPYVARYEADEPAADWAAAHALEVEAIAAERPIFNVNHNPDRGSLAADYKARRAAELYDPEAVALINSLFGSAS